MIVADDGVIKVTEAIQFMIRFHGHVFEFIAYLADMSETFDFVIGQKSMYELEATVDYNNLAFTFLKRSHFLCMQWITSLLNQEKPKTLHLN